jgi:alpha-ketoglutarate-dependent taurine dioxygenase
VAEVIPFPKGPRAEARSAEARSAEARPPASGPRPPATAEQVVILERLVELNERLQRSFAELAAEQSRELLEGYRVLLALLAIRRRTRWGIGDS